MTIGKGTLSLRKKDIVGQKSGGVGYTKVVFAHKATGGESSISLSALTTPTELSSQGFVQPSSGTLSDLNIYFYRRNVTVISSLRGVLMDFLSYQVMSNSVIRFNGFTLEPDEIITCVVDPVQKSDLMVVDGEALAATGSLEIGETDFSVGTPFEVNKYPTQQIGAVKVYRNGLLQARCEGNDLSNDGNYIEVPVSGGLGTLIRFKDAPALEAEAIIVTSNGALFERPQASQMAAIEALGGQMDKVIQALADATGQPTSYFQSNPNQVQLKQFGDTVLELSSDVAALTSAIQGYATASSSTHTPTGTNVHHQMTGNSVVLTAGEWEIDFQSVFASSGGDPGFRYSYHQLAAANGNNTSTSPTSVGSVATLLSGIVYSEFSSAATFAGNVHSNKCRLLLTGTATIYLVPYSNASLSTAFARVTSYIYAKKVK